MAATIVTKNSSTAGAAPTSSDLVQGELAVNVTDKRLYTENASGTVVELGTNPSSLTNAGNLTFTGTGNRITGDFSNATIANRVAFQSSTTNGATVIGVIPNGTSSTSAIAVYGSSDPTNCLYGGITTDNVNMFITAGINGTGSYGPMRFYTGGSERMRIDSSGKVLVGTTSFSGYGGLSISPNDTAGGAAVVYDRSSTTSTSFAAIFRNAGTNSGSISWNNTSTFYTTTSDYRLKENVKPMTGSLARVAALKPVTYKWKADGSDGEGFIAHELAEVVPQCVTGEKDVVDADGNPVYQSIDTSFLVATLTAAIQEQQAIINAQQAALTQLQDDVAALKGQA